LDTTKLKGDKMKSRLNNDGKAMKIKITPDANRSVQQILFDSGREWVGGGKHFIDHPFKFLYVFAGGRMAYDSDNNEQKFDNDPSPEYTLGLVRVRKHIFTANNTKPGDFVINVKSPKNDKDHSRAASVAYRIVFKVDSGDVRYGLSSILDGMIFELMSKEKLVKLLNKEFRPLPKKEYFYIIEGVWEK